MTSQIAVQGFNTIGDMARASAVKALGEVALRVNNLERMKRFYQEVLGFEVLGEFPNAALLKIAAGYAGHTQVLGLFDRSVSVDQERTTIDHITFTIGLLDYDSERKRLETLGLNVEVYPDRSIATRRFSPNIALVSANILACYPANWCRLSEARAAGSLSILSDDECPWIKPGKSVSALLQSFTRNVSGPSPQPIAGAKTQPK